MFSMDAMKESTYIMKTHLTYFAWDTFYFQQSKDTKGKLSVKGNESDESENTESNINENPPKIHVEFKEEPEEVVIKEVVQVPVKVVIFFFY